MRKRRKKVQPLGLSHGLVGGEGSQTNLKEEETIGTNNGTVPTIWNRERKKNLAAKKGREK